MARSEENIKKIVKQLREELKDNMFYTSEYDFQDRDAVDDLLEFVIHMDLDEFWEEE